MNAKLKLVAPTPLPLPTAMPRPVLSIVKGLDLDSVRLPKGSKYSKTHCPTASDVVTASNDDRIPASGRNNTLTSLAGSMRRKGMGAAAIEAALQAENTDKCDPPLDAAEVSAIAASIMRYPASSSDDIVQSLNGDNGIWRRIRLIPFVVTIPEAQQDKHLQAKLRTELPGILNWAIKGCKDWQKSGLGEPLVVTQAVDEYRQAMDLLSAWIADCCELGPAKEWKSREAYGSYKVWAEGGGYRPMSESVFSRELVMIYKKAKRNDGNYFLGIKQKVWQPSFPTKG